MKVKNTEGGGWRFYCPACSRAHVLDARWAFNGDRERPTFTPSVNVWHDGDENIPPYRCHSYVTLGAITYLSDCTHALKNQTLKLPDL